MKADEVRKIVERQESMGLSQVLLKIVKPKSYRQTSEYNLENVYRDSIGKRMRQLSL